jgi:uncharacterized damage-inducible protein DinB
MNAVFARPPASDEHAPYYERYTTLVPEGDILATLDRQGRETACLLGSLTDGQASYRYAPDRWSLKGVVGHVVDTERVFAYRVLAAARGIEGDIPGFDQDETAVQARFDERTLDELIDEFAFVRRATLSLGWPLDEDALSRRAVANGAPVTARALLWIIAGHERHHLQVLRERYHVGHARPASDG